MAAEKKTEYLRVGVIVRPHGVHGALKVMPLSDDVGRFNALSDAYLELSGRYESIKVTNANVQGSDVYLQIDSCNDRNAAERLRNVYICVDRSHARKLPEGEYFIVDLIGCRVVDTDGNDHGKLTDVFSTGANDVYEIKGERKLLLPALKKVLKTVDIDNKLITLDADVLAEVGLFED
ncbi:MAG: 16S rRNA processing protein RimM [Clostridia bacterium]|nr:16S rRNA processing protein RimM [Clostridia bacterium]